MVPAWGMVIATFLFRDELLSKSIFASAHLCGAITGHVAATTGSSPRIQSRGGGGGGGGGSFKICHVIPEIRSIENFRPFRSRVRAHSSQNTIRNRIRSDSFDRYKCERFFSFNSQRVRLERETELRFFFPLICRTMQARSRYMSPAAYTARLGP